MPSNEHAVAMTYIISKNSIPILYQIIVHLKFVQMKNLFYLLFFTLIFIANCTPAEQGPIDLGLTKADVVGTTEEGGVTRVTVSAANVDISKLKAPGSNVTFDQKGEGLALRRNNSVSGEFDCSCATVGDDVPSATGGCRTVIIGNFLNCQSNGCSGTCNLTIVINDLKSFVRFW